MIAAVWQGLYSDTMPAVWCFVTQGHTFALFDLPAMITVSLGVVGVLVSLFTLARGNSWSRQKRSLWWLRPVLIMALYALELGVVFRADIWGTTLAVRTRRHSLSCL